MYLLEILLLDMKVITPSAHPISGAPGLVTEENVLRQVEAEVELAIDYGLTRGLIGKS